MRVTLILACLTATAAALTEITAKNAEVTAKYAEIQAENAEIKAMLNATTTGELKIFNAEECPPGWVEFNKTQGYLLTGRPKGGETGTTINRPMDVGEQGRSPEHSHEIGVEDLGHTHVMTVNDPGHGHFTQACSSGVGGTGWGGSWSCSYEITSSLNKTGIVVDALPAKSNIQVSLASNKDGEGYPLVYVLICQRVLGN
jgi:hypothetical protein